MFDFLGLKIFYYAIVAIIIAGTVFTLKLLFVPLLISLFIAIVIRPLVTFFESKGFSHTTTIITIFSTLIITAVLAFILFIPLLSEQLSSFGIKIPEILNMLQEKAILLQNSIDNKLTFIDLSHSVQDIKESLIKNIDTVVGTFGSYISNIMNIMTFAILIPFFAFFILKDMHIIKKAILSYIPNRYFEIAALLFYRIGNSIQLYIRGQLIDATFVGVTTGIGLSIIGFPYALVVGLIAGIGNLVPYFGPVLGAIPAILIILVTPEWAVGSAIGLVIMVFLAVQIIETLFIYPAVVGNSVDLHPIIVVFALLIGGELAGILGMIIMIPAVAILKVTFQLLHRYMKEYKVIG